MSKGKLTSKQEQFCREYIIDFNATQAAIRAGYSEKTARNIATENLSKPVISEFIDHLKKETAERTEVSADKLTDFFKTVMDDYTQNVKDRIKAAENLAKRIGYYKTHNEQKTAGIQNALEIYAKMHEEKSDE